VISTSHQLFEDRSPLQEEPEQPQLVPCPSKIRNLDLEHEFEYDVCVTAAVSVSAAAELLLPACIAGELRMEIKSKPQRCIHGQTGRPARH
jgi:hypothetical protein